MFFPPDLYDNILKIHASIENRLINRSEQEQSVIQKFAFDSRRMQQETQINPRRNLQYYNRSEPFIGRDLAAQIKNLFKVKTSADNLKEQFLGEHDWFDSNCQILCNALDNTLRIKEGDYDFFQPQFDYMNELLYLRYRLSPDEIEKLSEEAIRERLLSKDEKLLYKTIYSNYKNSNPSKNIPALSPPSTPDQLIQTLFGNVKATKDQKMLNDRSLLQLMIVCRKKLKNRGLDGRI